MAKGSGLKKNKFMLMTIIGGVIVFAVVAFVVLSATATTKALVFNEDLKAGTTITDSMVQEVDIPQGTPGEYLNNANSAVGEKLVTNVKKGQFVYSNNLMSAVDVAERAENDQFVTTSIQLPDSRAIGGLLTAGDIVDISVVPTRDSSKELAAALPDYNIDPQLEGGIYFILSNVKILDSTTSVSSEQGSDLSSTVSQDVSEDEGSSFYLVSLSYNDFKKLRLAEQYGNIYLSLAPAQNEKYAPMIEQMQEAVNGGLSDSSTKPIKEVNPNAGVIDADNTKSNKKSNSNNATGAETSDNSGESTSSDSNEDQQSESSSNSEDDKTQSSSSSSTSENNR